MASTAGPNARITSGCGGPDVATQDAQCRRARQLQQRRQRESAQHGDRGEEPDAERREAGRRQVAVAAAPRAPSRATPARRNPTSEPRIAANNPTIVSCTRLTVSVNARVAPSVFSSATESRCRCT